MSKKKHSAKFLVELEFDNEPLTDEDDLADNLSEVVANGIGISGFSLLGYEDVPQTVKVRVFPIDAAAFTKDIQVT